MFRNNAGKVGMHHHNLGSENHSVLSEGSLGRPSMKFEDFYHIV